MTIRCSGCGAENDKADMMLDIYPMIDGRGIVTRSAIIDAVNNALLGLGSSNFRDQICQECGNRVDAELEVELFISLDTEDIATYTQDLPPLFAVTRTVYVRAYDGYEAMGLANWDGKVEERTHQV